MKKSIVEPLAVIGMAIIAAWCFSPAKAAETQNEEPAAKEKAADNPLHLSEAKRAAAGIVLTSPRNLLLAPEVEAFGRVLDPTPYVTLVAEVATARAALAASEKELERAKKLFAGGGNASAQAVEAAEAAAARDRAAVASADIRLIAGWGRELADNVDLTALREMLAKGASFVRIDALMGSAPVSESKTARVSPVGGAQTFDVEVVGPAPVADPQVQGASFLAILRGHTLPAGTSLRATLPGPGEKTSVLTVPQQAVVYYQGSAWVYTLGKNDTFSRELVTLERSVGDDVVIVKGVDADDKVVTVGAGQLLSAELQTGGAPDED